jgi:hypothetical protein
MPLLAQLSQVLEHAGLWLRTIPSFVFGALFSALLFVVQQQVSRYLAHRKMSQLNFLDRINVSLNLFVDGKLKIRTLFERPLDEVVHNRHVREVLQSAAFKASAGDDPIVRMPDAQSWFILNCVLNSIAERFSDGVFREQRGLPVERANFAFWVTCEPATAQRERKIRVFMMEEELLRNFPFAEKMPELESEKHRDRVHSLRRSCEVFRTDPQLFSRVEICM